MRVLISYNNGVFDLGDLIFTEVAYVSKLFIFFTIVLVKKKNKGKTNLM